LGTLAQKSETPGIDYLYLPLDDDLFEHGIEKFFPETEIPPWNDRSDKLYWRGSCSGEGGNQSIRVRFVDKMYSPDNEIRLSLFWADGKDIPLKYFDNRSEHTEFMKYKIFFIVEGGLISSSHMWAFASGCVPLMICDTKCWFSEYLIPFIHFIPVKPSLENLTEMIDFVKDNDFIAKRIAKNARQFALEYFSHQFQFEYLKEKIRLLENFQEIS
jgi:hypothetical protein